MYRLRHQDHFGSWQLERTVAPWQLGEWSWCRSPSQRVLYISSVHAMLQISRSSHDDDIPCGGSTVGATTTSTAPLAFCGEWLPSEAPLTKMVLVSFLLTGRPVHLLRTCHAPYIMLVYIQTHGVGQLGCGGPATSTALGLHPLAWLAVPKQKWSWCRCPS